MIVVLIRTLRFAEAKRSSPLLPPFSDRSLDEADWKYILQETLFSGWGPTILIGSTLLMSFLGAFASAKVETRFQFAHASVAMLGYSVLGQYISTSFVPVGTKVFSEETPLNIHVGSGISIAVGLMIGGVLGARKVPPRQVNTHN